MNSYSCGVGNCGNGKCIHKVLKENCPHCGASLVLVTTTGFVFCSSGLTQCGYETKRKLVK